MCSKELERFGDLITMLHDGERLILEDASRRTYLPRALVRAAVARRRAAVSRQICV